MFGPMPNHGAGMCPVTSTLIPGADISPSKWARGPPPKIWKVALTFETTVKESAKDVTELSRNITPRIHRTGFIDSSHIGRVVSELWRRGRRFRAEGHHYIPGLRNVNLLLCGMLSQDSRKYLISEAALDGDWSRIVLGRGDRLVAEDTSGRKRRIDQRVVVGSAGLEPATSCL